MTILGIETSCDETAAAIVENGTTLISQSLASSQSMHAKYGGIIPDKAAREQLKSILPVIHECLTASNYSINKIDAIAITYGPGLIGSLLVGVETAKSLALAWNKPIIPVNHLVGHIYANWIIENLSSLPLNLLGKIPELPALILLVSGGHSEIILMNKHKDYKILGSTRDDAAGECFDKCGRLLGLPYPYGPYIQTEAEKYVTSDNQITFPRPLINSKDFDFSFSGLKTSFANAVKKISVEELPHLIPKLCYELQEAITDVLVTKTILAAKEYSPKSIILAGGVAANKRLREKLQTSVKEKLTNTNLYIPPISLCTDNAVYIAACAYFNNEVVALEKVDATADLEFDS